MIYILIIMLSFIAGNLLFVFFFLKEQAPKLALFSCLSMNTFLPLIFGTLFSSAMSGFKTYGGLSSLGGVTGMIASCMFCVYNFPKLKQLVMKCFCLSVPLMYSVSKMACYFGGCCGGIVLKGKTFPVQITETVVFFIIFVTGCVLLKKPTAKNEFRIISACCTAKFTLDFLRQRDCIFSVNQIICTVFFISFFIVYRISCQKRSTCNG